MNPTVVRAEVEGLPTAVAQVGREAWVACTVEVAVEEGLARPSGQVAMVAQVSAW
jgi:hypothetical protein